MVSLRVCVCVCLCVAVVVSCWLDNLLWKQFEAVRSRNVKDTLLKQFRQRGMACSQACGMHLALVVQLPKCLSSIPHLGQSLG